MKTSHKKAAVFLAVSFFLFIIAIFISSCSKDGESGKHTQGTATVVKLEELISHLPADILPSKAPIRIRFLEKQAEYFQIGVKMKKTPLRFKPSVKGYLAWEDAYTLAYYPEKPLKQGEKYDGFLDIEELLGEIRTVDDVTFSFSVATQELIKITGRFIPDEGGKPEEMFFTAGLYFIEPVTPEECKNRIVALKDDRKIKIELSQSKDERKITLKSEKITRKDIYQTITVEIKKELAGLPDYSEAYTLSPMREFAVNTVTIIDEGGELGFDLLFSDPLDSSRDMTAYFLCEPEVSVDLEVRDRVLKVRGPFERGIGYKITLKKGLPGSFGTVMARDTRRNVKFKHLDPAINFDQRGVVLPFSGKRSISFRSVNLDSVVVSVEKIFASNIGQFLQINRFEAADRRYRYYQNRRVAEEVYRNVIRTNPEIDTWERTELDLGPLIDKERNAFYAVNLNYFHGQQRRYRRYNVSKLLISTDLGITLKKANDRFHVFVNSIESAEPVSRAKVILYSYQLQELDRAITDNDGYVAFDNDSGYYIAAEKDADRSYITTRQDVWKTNTFETEGVQVHPGGTNAFIYTDRGVYRPGDTIHLSCIARNQAGTFPDLHPVTLKLFNPRGQEVASWVKKDGKEGLYCFDIVTKSSDITGTWSAKLLVGDRSFQKKIRIETVIPNRLKVEIAFDDTVTGADFGAEVSSRWLFGTPASGLKCITDITLLPVEKTYKQFNEFIFSNPALAFSEIRKTVWEGKLGENGTASFTVKLPSMNNVPSALGGSLKTRVFEKGGNFTAEIRPVFIDTYSSYVGIRPLKTRWGNIQAGKSHNIPVIVVNRDGKAVSGRQLSVNVYRNNRYWWWDYERESSQRFRYRRDQNTRLISEDTIISGNDPVNYTFEANLSGQYFIEVHDKASGHSTGMFVYVSSWGEETQDLPQRADVVRMRSDRNIYNPGQIAKITVETPSKGMALVTLEKANDILWSRWLPMSGREMTFDVPVTEDMLPNIYVSVSQIQPRGSRTNDLPVRMYGILPLMVEEEKTHLPLSLRINDELKPNSEFEVELEITDGRDGYATIAIVDEGILDLTDFKTPDPWKYFFAKEKLSIVTSDIFDLILDTVRGSIAQRYTIGGDYNMLKRQEPQGAKRFEPVAMFSGPLYIPKGKPVKVHFKMPNYVGSVRIMTVASKGTSYTSVEKTTPVKSPLMVLPTVPRVIGPGETFDLPVTVFAMNTTIREAQVTVIIDSLLTVIGNNSQTLTFDHTGDKEAFFRVKSEKAVGIAHIITKVVSGSYSAEERISLSVRPSNPYVSAVKDTVLTEDSPLSMTIPEIGIPGTNKTRLIVSSAPDLNITSRLNYLIRYPHGCLEQTTSAAFPQIYMRDLLSLDGVSGQEVDGNINACIQKLQSFQLANGAFTFWPGSTTTAQWSWTHAYAGHFLLSARVKGFYVPEKLLDTWVLYTQREVRKWPENKWQHTVQAYELFLLAIAGSPQVGMMNWVREDRSDSLTTLAGWLLAGAYHTAGRHDTAQKLLLNLNTEVSPYREFGMTYGSAHRDRALILYLADMMDKPVLTARLYGEIVRGFNDRKYYYNTQETGLTLMAVSSYLEKHGSTDVPGNLELKIEGIAPISFSLENGRKYHVLTGAEGKSFELTSDSASPLYVVLHSEGIPLDSDVKTESHGLSLNAEWLDEDGLVIDPTSVEQGSTFWGHFRAGKSYNERVDELALSIILPSGWEIENLRLTGENRPEWMNTMEIGKEDYCDIRDDRIHWYFDLPVHRYSRNTQHFDFCVKINATYSGEFTLPAATLEAMYNPEYYARVAVRKVVVEK